MKRSLAAFCVFMLAMLAGIYAAYAEEPVKITIATYISPAYEDLFPMKQRFADRIRELGQGKVQVQFHHSETVFKAKDLVPALMTGTCDIILHLSAVVNEHWPEVSGIGLPFLYKDESDCQNHLLPGKPLFELLNHEMNKKYGVRMLTSGILRGMIIATSQKAIEKPDDFNGLKIRSLGKVDADYIRACGGVTLSLQSHQMNEALKKGTLDGVITYPGTIISRKLNDELNYITETKPMFGAWAFHPFVLGKTFDKWDKEVQNIVMQAASEYSKNFLEKSLEYDRQKVKPLLEKKIKYISPNSYQMKQFIEVAQKTYAEWSKTVDPEFAKKFIELSQVQ